MHKFFRAAGFSEYTTDGTIYRFIRGMVERPENLAARLSLGDGAMLLEYRMPVNQYVGICAAIIHSGSEFSEIQYYYPYFHTGEISSDAACSLERHTAVETYSGIIDEYNIGLSLIFFVTNPMDYRIQADFNESNEFRGTSLTAFANEAVVLLPVVPQEDYFDDPGSIFEDEQLLEAAREGDENAIETLTRSDIDMFHQISERIESEDLYSLVDQSFMPCGVECDQYSIIGVITELGSLVNELTQEELWMLKVSCNDVEFWLCIRKDDLTGEPMIGRRLKGKIWMTGKVNIA